VVLLVSSEWIKGEESGTQYNTELSSFIVQKAPKRKKGNSKKSKRGGNVTSTLPQQSQQPPHSSTHFQKKYHSDNVLEETFDKYDEYSTENDDFGNFHQKFF
jgi:hypothetical protein